MADDPKRDYSISATFLIFIAAGLLVLSFLAIPPSVDYFYLRELSQSMIVFVVQKPIDLYDALSHTQFNSRNCGYICFASIQQLAFMITFNLIALYGLACTTTILMNKKF